MKTHARVVVIGGGVIGCSVLYHLTKMGWTDVVLCERKELTAGSSWHAAGGFHALNSDPGVSRLQAYTINLYRQVEKLSGQDIGLHFTGGLNVAATPDRWDLLRADWARHRVMGLETQLLGPAEIRKLCPLMDTKDVLGALFDPQEGHLDPSGATLAYAKAARLAGAEIYRQTKVEKLIARSNGQWQVMTDKGTIEAEHVVNAGGLWAREVGHMAGVDLPVVAMEHHYLLTEDLPELRDLSREIPLVLDLDAEIYLRQERKGVLLGVYEKDATPWALKGTPWDYGQNDLLPPQLDRLADALEKGFQRFPALSNAGIRRIVNGPFTFTPDGNPLVGPVPGLRNYWAACGVMAGFAQGGGVGLSLAQWIAEGEPGEDIFAMDVARFGPYATRAYSIAKGKEFYARRFQMAYPNEYWPAGRPSKVSAAHTILETAKGVFGASFGMEIPLYFSRSDTDAREIPSLRRSNAFSTVSAECAVARQRVGVLDISSFGKYLCCGPQAENALSRLLAGRIPTVGQIRLTPMLSPSGRLMGDLTTLRLSDEQFLVTGSGYLQTWHMRWFADHLRQDGLHIHNVSDQYGGIAIFGPRSRELLGHLTEQDVTNAACPFMSVRKMDVGRAPAWIARLSVTGELGYEIYVPVAYLPELLHRVLALAYEVEGDLVGMYALNSLRLEKGFGIWSREFSRDYTPRMAGFDRFIDYERDDFIGRDAAVAARYATPEKRLVSLAVEAADCDASGYEPIYKEDALVGFVTSGGFGHTSNTSLAMGYVESSVAADTIGLTVTILGIPRACRILAESLVDPTGSRMRG